MRALVFHGPHLLAVEEKDSPTPTAGEVLIEVIATGICGSDLHGFTGENGRRVAGQVMGHELVGRVAAFGEGVRLEGVQTGSLVTVDPVIPCNDCEVCAAPGDDLCPNRRVIGVDPLISSAFAERMSVPAPNVVALPPGTPELVGALVEPLSVGFHAARRGGVREGSAVLVLGGGPIGQAAALGARRLGAVAVVSEPIRSRADRVASLGFTVVDPQRPGFADAVLEALGRKPDVVIDAVGIDGTLRDALTISRQGATVVLVGMGVPSISLDAYRISTDERSVVGSFCYTAREFRETAGWVAENANLLLPLIDAVVPLADAPEVFGRLASGELDASKVLVGLQAVRSDLLEPQR